MNELELMGAEKSSTAHTLLLTVLQTDTGGWGENPKASGSMFVKELGKKAGVPSVYTLTLF